MQADNTLGNEYAQIKTRYPLLRGILHIMTKDWLSSAILRGLPIVLVGGYFYLFYVIFLYVRDPTSIDLGQEGVLLAHTEVKALSDTCGWSRYFLPLLFMSDIQD